MSKRLFLGSNELCFLYWIKLTFSDKSVCNRAFDYHAKRFIYMVE